MVDETRITFAQAARLPILKVGGRAPHIQSLWRWSTTGIRRGEHRIKLETVCVGGRRLTSAESVSRFIERLNSTAPTEPTPSQKSSRYQRAVKELAEAGI
jgi:hypothetical protein